MAWRAATSGRRSSQMRLKSTMSRSGRGFVTVAKRLVAFLKETTWDAQWMQRMHVLVTDAVTVQRLLGARLVAQGASPSTEMRIL
jgi:hypothetical protein